MRPGPPPPPAVDERVPGEGEREEVLRMGREDLGRVADEEEDAGEANMSSTGRITQRSASGDDDGDAMRAVMVDGPKEGGCGEAVRVE